MKVATRDGDELATAEVKGYQVNGALTGMLVGSCERRARSRSSLLFLKPWGSDRDVRKALLTSPAGARADDKGGE